MRFSFPDHSLSFHEPRTTPTCPQATEQFKKDADALLAPFGNRIPAGVKGLDAVLSEYVAFKEADAQAEENRRFEPPRQAHVRRFRGVRGGNRDSGTEE
jgi:hypothetical protein